MVKAEEEKRTKTEVCRCVGGKNTRSRRGSYTLESCRCAKERACHAAERAMAGAQATKGGKDETNEQERQEQSQSRLKQVNWNQPKRERACDHFFYSLLGGKSKGGGRRGGGFGCGTAGARTDRLTAHGTGEKLMMRYEED